MKKKMGFTILEILAVIVIIATVTAIAVPSIFKITNKARERLYCSKLEIVQKSAERYADDNDLANICSIDNIEYDCESITIQDLINGNYIDSDGLDGAFLDPRDNTSLNTKEVLVYEKDSRSYAYISDSACPSLVTSALSPDELNNVKHNLTVSTDGGTWSGTSPVTLRERQTLFVNDPVKAGSDFIRWEVTGNDSDINDNIFTMGLEDSTLTAIWDVYGYVLTVLPNGGTWNGTSPQLLQTGNQVVISRPVKAGSLFTGWTISGSGSFIGDTTFVVGTSNTTLTANWLPYSSMYTYTGNSLIVDAGDSTNWKIKLLTSGTFTPLINMTIDAFLVGGGGGGSGNGWGYAWSGGGGGGYTKTYTRVNLTANQGYTIVIGGGGGSCSKNNVAGSGGASTGFGYTANGGAGGSNSSDYGTQGNGGNGGSGGGCSTSGGGSDGASGGVGNHVPGTGQGTTTREFGEATGDLYAGGGSGGYTWNAGGAGGGGATGVGGTANTGGGGGSTPYTGPDTYGTTGGSGIIIIRNTKINEVGSTTKYSFSYSGSYTILNGSTDNWKVKFLTSGTLTSFTSNKIDIFLVGGGGGGSGNGWGYAWSGGGGGGYTKTYNDYSLVANQTYSIVIGNGGGGCSKNNVAGTGGTTTAFGYSASGGLGGSNSSDYGTQGNGGNGGSGGGTSVGTGGSDGGNGGGGTDHGIAGVGQGTTTREFGEATGDLYAGGGSGGYLDANPSLPGGNGGGGSNNVGGTPNTGGGGGSTTYTGPDTYGTTGGTGIVVIRAS